MKSFTKIFLMIFTIASFAFSQNAELISQQITIENAIKSKVDAVVNKFLKSSEYLTIVNARLDFKPVSLKSVDEKFMGEVNEISCESMYTFIVKDRGSVIIDNHIFATYGHHLEGDVISHNYFGTEKVVQDLKMFETYDYGHINLIKTDIKRGRDGLINKIIHIEDKFFQAFL